MSRIERDEEEDKGKLGRAGYIKCGEKYITKDGKESVRSFDYFKAIGDHAKFFHDVYGEKPTRISIVFISDNNDDSCDERKELRKGAKLYAYGNGKVFQVYDEKLDSYAEKSIKDNPTLVKDLEKFCDEEFEEVLTMRFIILDVKGIFGFWQLTTRGKDSSLPQIRYTFDIVQKIAGTVRNIPFDLKIEKHISQKPNSKHSYPVITLIPNVCKENLDRLGGLIKSGVEMSLSGLLTEQKILEMKPLQIENQVKDAFQGTVVEADYKIDNEEEDSENLKKAIKLLQYSKTFQELTKAVEAVKKIKLSDDEKGKATVVWREMVDSIKDRKKETG